MVKLLTVVHSASPEAITSQKDQLSALIASEISGGRSDILVNRFFELAVQVSHIHADLVPVAQEAVDATFKIFFSKADDMLFQLAMMDLIVQLGLK